MAREITVDEIKIMQKHVLEMMVEFDKLCRKHNIKYSMSGGTMLGAIRHGGFIPWDEDADINMLREEYEKFRKVAHELDENICFFQDNENDEEYRWGYGKLRKANTVLIKAGQEHLKCATGVCMDVFPFDDVPKTLPFQLLQDFKCFCVRKTLWSEVGKEQAHGLEKAIYAVLSKIDKDWAFRRINGYIRKSRNDRDCGVRTLLYPAIGHLYRKSPLKIRYAMPKKWYTQLAEYEFEGHQFYGAQDYDGYLHYVYGDYMTLPPEEKRVSHTTVSELIL